MLDILCRLTASSATVGTQGRDPEQHQAELARMSTSSLESAWLEHVAEHGYLKPDRAQHTLSAVGTCVDFFYDDLNLAVFVDGPHHESDAQKQKDAEINRRLDELGYIVVRFGFDTSAWMDVFENNADLFGNKNR